MQSTGRKLIACLLLGLLAAPLRADLFVAGQASGTTIGGVVSGGTATRVLFIDGSGNLANDADLTFATDTLTATKIGSTTLTGTNVATGRNTFGSAADAANSIDLGGTANCITFEGTSADAFEINFCGGNSSFDTTTSIPAVQATQTIAILEGAQTFSGIKTFSNQINFTASGTFGPVLATGTRFVIGGNESQYGGIWSSTANTPDSGALFTGTLSNCIMVAETGDVAFDFENGPNGTSASTNPCVVVRDKDQNKTDYQAYSVVGLTGKYTVTLTESSATTVLTIPVADNTSVAGTLQGKVFASDGTNHQVRSMLLRYAVVNEADDETCALTDADGTTANAETNDGNVSAITSGTLTYAIACTEGTNSVTITFNAVSSLTQTTLSFEGQNFHVGGGEPLP